MQPAQANGVRPAEPAASAGTRALPIDSTRPVHGSPAHDATAFNQARAWQNDPASQHVRFNQELVDANGQRLTTLRPDAYRIRQDGKIDILEVRSRSQTASEMNAKLAEFRRILGARAGDIKWVDPIPAAQRMQ